ncbi:MAG: type II secretion system protein [bacterium]
MINGFVLQEQGFTFIELLVVVGIITILIGLFTSNLLTARTKAKVSRAIADMRSIATVLEIYVSDKQTYPPNSAENKIDTTDLVPTYITSVPLDPFTRDHFRYYTAGESKKTAYLLVSDGPDGTPDITSYHAISGPAGGPEGPWPVVIGGGDGVGEGEWYKPTVDSNKGDIGRGGP